MTDTEKLDIIIFGATGFTGKYAVVELVKLVKEIGNITWGIAGRSESKLKDVLKEIEDITGENLKDTPKIIAKVDDEDSLQKMATRAKVVINCVGPYRFYGEPVVKACVNNGTHHVDVSGEPNFISEMQLKYHEQACENGAYIISACGFDSIPADMGAIFLKKKFNGEVNSIETYLKMWIEIKPKGAVIHYGTWDSFVNAIPGQGKLKSLLKKLYPNDLPQMLPKLKPKSFIHKSKIVNGWCVPFLGADVSVMDRTQRLLHEYYKERPIQVQNYVAFPSLFIVLGLCIAGLMLFVTGLTKCGRKLLRQHPRFFSAGYVSHEGPSEQVMKNTKFCMTLYGEGWKEKSANTTEQHTEPPNKKMVAKVSGTNPAYGATTCIALVLSAITILHESDRMPGRGGVLSPGAAFANTSLIEELDKHGVKFEVVSTEEK